jgi:hypothetical protein
MPFAAANLSRNRLRKASDEEVYMTTLTHFTATQPPAPDAGLMLGLGICTASSKARAFMPHRMYARYAEAVREGFQSDSRVRLQRSNPVNLEPQVLKDTSELHAMKPGQVLSAEFGEACRIMATYLGHEDFRILVFERQGDLWQMAQVSALSLGGLTRLLHSNALGAPSTLMILGG